MRKVKTYKKFLEAISGTTDTMPFGPGMPRPESPNTINNSDTHVVYDENTGKFYSEDDYYELYNKYIENGGKPLSDGLNPENLQEVLSKQ